MANKNFRVRHGLEVEGSIEAVDLTLSGDLTVNGNTTVINTQTVNIEDNIITLNSNVTGAPSTDAGIEIERGTSANVQLRWNETDDKWQHTRDGSTYFDLPNQSLNTTNDATFTGVTAGNISIGVSTDNTITSTNTNGDILITPNGTGDVDLVADTVQIGDANATATLTTNGTGNLVLNTNSGTNSGAITLAQGTNGNINLTPNGTGFIIFDSAQRLRGESQASTDNSYVFPAGTLTSVTDNNGYSASSSIGTAGSGYTANAQYIQYTADTRAGTNAVANLNFRQANGNSVAGVTIPWTGGTSVAPAASAVGDVIGGINMNGYATTGFTNDVATQYQGGGLATTHIVQVQGYTTEVPADSTRTLGSSDITAVSTSVRAALGSPQITGTRGQISFNATTCAVGQAIRVTGTLTGTGTGIVSGTNYWIIETNGTTTATLSATPNGYPITTTAGTLTGLTLTRCFVTFTLANQTVFPFGRNALVTVANVTNVTNGTYPVSGAPSLTSVSLGIPHTVAPTLPGTQQFSITTVTNAGGGFRIRAMPAATIMNPSNRTVIFDTTAAATVFRSDSVTFNTGAYGGTGATMATLDSSGNLALTGDLRVNGNDIRSSDNTSQIVMSAAGTTLELRGNNIQLENAAGSALTSAGVSYTRTYGEFAYTNAAGFAIAAQNTIYAMPLDTTLANSGTSISNTSRINIAVAGWYKIIISLQATLTVSNQAGQFDFWLRKNGADVPNSKTQVDLLKDQKSVISMDWLVNSDGDDYWEIVYVGTTANFADIDFPTIAATTTPYVSPVAPALLVNVIPAGM